MVGGTIHEPVPRAATESLAQANEGRAIPVSLSIGTASWPEIPQSCDKILETADAAMYADKRAQKAAAGSVPRTTGEARTGRVRLSEVG